jgi:hypothetical protein
MHDVVVNKIAVAERTHKTSFAESGAKEWGKASDRLQVALLLCRYHASVAFDYYTR